MLKLTVPPSKSMSHRLLMGAALAKGKSIIHNTLSSKDIECTMDVLKGVGASFNYINGSMHVQGIEPTHMQAQKCYMHESGTSCRLLMSILAALQGNFYIYGAPRLHQRPVGALVEALQSVGVEIHHEKQKGFLPLRLVSKGFKKNSVHINIDESSQYLSGLLLAAPLLINTLDEKCFTIYLQGKKAVSWPYVALTLQTLKNFGIEVQVQQNIAQVWQDIHWPSLQEIDPTNSRFCVNAGQYVAGEYTVEGDWSNASYFLAAGAVGHKKLCIQGLSKDSLQGDKAILDILSAMGANYAWYNDDIVISPSKLRAVQVDMKHCPDLVPTVAMLAAFAEGETVINNVAHLRIKECDRLNAPATELKKIGVKVQVFEDGLSIQGLGKAPIIPQNTVFSTYNDHRMAMSCALLGLNGQRLLLDDDQVVEKSFPTFWDIWSKVQ